MRDVDKAFVHGCRPNKNVKTFLRLDGKGCNDITLMNNDFNRVGQVVEKGEDVVDKAMCLVNNRLK